LFVLGLVFAVVSRACSSADTATVWNTSCMLFAAVFIYLTYCIFIPLFALFIHSSPLLHPSLCCGIHSFISRIASSSSSLPQYSSIHPSPLLHPALCCGIHSFISRITSSSIAWLQYPVIHHHFSIQLFAAIFIR
jgi:hypothetical protein